MMYHKFYLYSPQRIRMVGYALKARAKNKVVQWLYKNIYQFLKDQINLVNTCKNQQLILIKCKFKLTVLP
jgi:hypothetical protein